MSWGPYEGVSGPVDPDPALFPPGAASRLCGFKPAWRIGWRTSARQTDRPSACLKLLRILIIGMHGVFLQQRLLQQQWQQQHKEHRRNRHDLDAGFKKLLREHLSMIMHHKYIDDCKYLSVHVLLKGVLQLLQQQVQRCILLLQPGKLRVFFCFFHFLLALRFLRMMSISTHTGLKLGVAYVFVIVLEVPFSSNYRGLQIIPFLVRSML
jgi:hypothetical protein